MLKFLIILLSAFVLASGYTFLWQHDYNCAFACFYGIALTLSWPLRYEIAP